MRVLAIGISARALAQSIRAAGLTPVAVDYFGDRDLAETCECVSLSATGLPFSTGGLVEAARRLAPFDWIILAGGLENDPAAVAQLQQLGVLAGNPPAVLERIRHWPLVAGRLRDHGLRVPPSVEMGSTAPSASAWLQKPIRSGGGVGVRMAVPGQAVPEGYRLERFIPGIPGSALFLADGTRARVLAVTDQIMAGLDILSAPGFLYRGNILRTDVSPAEHKFLAEACTLVTREFGLVGLNGVDFIRADGEPVFIEVNPRWIASAELWECAAGESPVPMHLQAIAYGHLPDRIPVWSGCYGKAILYGDRAGVWRFDGDWKAAGLRDVPAAGEQIVSGRPVCTLIASGSDTSAVRLGLQRLAERVRGEWIV